MPVQPSSATLAMLAVVIYRNGLMQKGITTCEDDEMTFSPDLSWMSNHDLSAGPDG